jgi:UDP-N-acetylglucosamine--N-acetylmuramyl-(pentapeptide) pyrophosphoryl-undecaprenol N-acetylglucosamine transferase
VIAVVGMGGYVSAPTLIAARISGRDIYLCEQNTVPGKVTLRFGRRARRIFATFEESANYFRKPVSMITVGNPIRSKVLSTPDRDTARRMFNLSHCKKVVLLIGGSQGALALNELILNLRTRYAADFGEVGIIWCTGSLSYEKYAKIVRENSAFGSVYISPFIEDMGPAYRAADIAISRSGSGVMMEMAALELPSVLIPYPHAAADHQSKNADAFVKAGAAVKVDQAKAGADDFAPVFFSILKSGARLEAMRMACRKAAKPHAARDILNEICGD